MVEQKIFQPYEFLESGMLAENLLYFDQVILWLSQIPTIVEVIGLETFEQALDQNAFLFLDTNTHILQHYNSMSENDCLKESLSEVISNLGGVIFVKSKGKLSISQADTIAAEVMEKCKSCLRFVNSQKNEFGQLILQETLKDERGLALPKYLDDLAMNKMFTKQRLFTINLELAILRLFKIPYLVTTPDLSLLHFAKFHTSNIVHALPPFAQDTYNRIKNIIWELHAVENIIDIGQLIQQNILTYKEIVELRSTSDGKHFRAWFHQIINDPNKVRDTKSFIKYYFEFIRKRNLRDSCPIKVLRFATASLLGLLGPIPGILSNTIDSFVVEYLLDGWKPSFFLHDKLYSIIAPRLLYKGRK